MGVSVRIRDETWADWRGETGLTTYERRSAGCAGRESAQCTDSRQFPTVIVLRKDP